MSMYKLEEYESIIEKCSHCSYCQATCPSYLSQMSESYVAKNRLLFVGKISKLLVYCGRFVYTNMYV